MSAGSSRFYDLASARPEGWFEEVLKQSPDFERACQIIGRSTLGLALVAGARIASLTPSAVSQNKTVVEFSIGPESDVHQLVLPEFREIIAHHLLIPIEAAGLPEDPDVQALQAHVGGRYMLEASLFGVRALELRHDLGLSEIALEFNGVRHVLALEEFREVIDERVRAELGLGAPDQEESIDLALVDRAEDANAKGEWTATIAMLSPWLNPISMLLRTGESDELSTDAHRRLSDGLDLLGTAYANIGELEAANEVLRLGVQWAGETSKAADLFYALGRASVQGGKHGEAIGLLRRSIRLGVEEKLVLPLLARSLQAREQGLAAMVCLERARELEVLEGESAELRATLEEHFGETWSAFAAWMSDPE